MLHCLLVRFAFFCPPITFLACLPALCLHVQLFLSTVGGVSVCLSPGTDGVWLVRVQVRQ